MRVCAKEGCTNRVPKYFIDKDGKKHNCQRRKFCFFCSPFGEHNTIDFNALENRGICSQCGRPTQKGKYNRKKCSTCYFQEKQKRISDKVYRIVGYSCWFCGYDKGNKGQSVLEFHHIDPSKKMFGLSTREFVGKKWKDVFKEMTKCISLCCRCHREFHAGLISKEQIYDIYIKKWKDIRENKEKLELILNKKKGRICPVCKREFFKSTVYCSDQCYRISRRISIRPSKEQLLKEVEETNFCATGRKYEVSDNCIRKWLK